MTPRKDAADLISWAKERGWAYEGVRGNGHPSLRWHDGSLYTIAATASDWRNARNAKAELARIDGLPVDHIKRGKVRHVPADGFSMGAAVREQARRDQLAADQDDALDAARAESDFRNLARKSWLRKYTALRSLPSTRADAALIEPRLLEAVAKHRAALAHLEAVKDGS